MAVLSVPLREVGRSESSASASVTLRLPTSTTTHAAATTTRLRRSSSAPEMPSFYSGVQRSKIQEFVAVTSVGDKIAAKILKANDWITENALNSYYQSGGGKGAGGAASSANARWDLNSLNAIFDQYRDAAHDEPDHIGVDGTIRYMGDLNVQLDEVVVLAIGELLQWPTMGEMNRTGFVRGWQNLKADTLQKQQAVVAKMRENIAHDDDLFKRTYRYTFELARQGQQRSVDLEVAVEYWRTLFSPAGGREWVTPKMAWFDRWIRFLTVEHKRPVTRDLWNMTHEFRRRTIEDESLVWWDEADSWPSVVDDFIRHLQKSGYGVPSKKAGDGDGDETDHDGDEIM